MELSLNSIWEWSKLTLRDPRMASLLAKATQMPLQASVLIIIITGILSGLMSGMVGVLVPSPPVESLSETAEVMTIEDLGPFILAGLTIFGNLSLMYFVHWIGAKFDGKGSLSDVAAVTAVLQIVMTVILVGQVAVRLVVPVMYFATVLFGIFVFLRGLGHAVNVAHDFDDLGKSAMVIGLSFVASVLVASFVVAILGIGPELAMEGSEI